MFLLGAMATAGIFIAAYFSLATYHIIPEDLIETLPVCNVHGKPERIVDTFYGRVFYLPNSLYGLLYYSGMLFSVITWGSVWPRGYLTFGFVASAGVLIFSGFLYWSLRKRLFTLCRLCITSHLLNLGIFICLLILWLK